MNTLQNIENEQLSKLKEYISSLGGQLDGAWRCRANIRDFGSRAGSMDTWFTAPHGETFRSKVAVSSAGPGAVGGARGCEGGAQAQCAVGSSGSGGKACWADGSSAQIAWVEGTSGSCCSGALAADWGSGNDATH